MFKNIFNNYVKIGKEVYKTDKLENDEIKKLISAYKKIKTDFLSTLMNNILKSGQIVDDDVKFIDYCESKNYDGSKKFKKFFNSSSIEGEKLKEFRTSFKEYHEAFLSIEENIFEASKAYKTIEKKRNEIKNKMYFICGDYFDKYPDDLKKLNIELEKMEPDFNKLLKDIEEINKKSDEYIKQRNAKKEFEKDLSIYKHGEIYRSAHMNKESLAISIIYKLCTGYDILKDTDQNEKECLLAKDTKCSFDNLTKNLIKEWKMIEYKDNFSYFLDDICTLDDVYHEYTHLQTYAPKDEKFKEYIEKKEKINLQKIFDNLDNIISEGKIKKDNGFTLINNEHLEKKKKELNNLKEANNRYDKIEIDKKNKEFENRLVKTKEVKEKCKGIEDLVDSIYECGGENYTEDSTVSKKIEEFETTVLNIKNYKYPNEHREFIEKYNEAINKLKDAEEKIKKLIKEGKENDEKEKKAKEEEKKKKEEEEKKEKEEKEKKAKEEKEKPIIPSSTTTKPEHITSPELKKPITTKHTHKKSIPVTTKKEEKKLVNPTKPSSTTKPVKPKEMSDTKPEFKHKTNIKPKRKPDMTPKKENTTPIHKDETTPKDSKTPEKQNQSKGKCACCQNSCCKKKQKT